MVHNSKRQRTDVRCMIPFPRRKNVENSNLLLAPFGHDPHRLYARGTLDRPRMLPQAMKLLNKDLKKYLMSSQLICTGHHSAQALFAGAQLSLHNVLVRGRREMRRQRRRGRFHRLLAGWQRQSNAPSLGVRTSQLEGAKISLHTCQMSNEAATRSGGGATPVGVCFVIVTAARPLRSWCSVRVLTFNRNWIFEQTLNRNVCQQR